MQKLATDNVASRGKGSVQEPVRIFFNAMMLNLSKAKKVSSGEKQELRNEVKAIIAKERGVGELAPIFNKIGKRNGQLRNVNLSDEVHGMERIYAVSPMPGVVQVVCSELTRAMYDQSLKPRMEMHPHQIATLVVNENGDGTRHYLMVENRRGGSVPQNLPIERLEEGALAIAERILNYAPWQ